MAADTAVFDRGVYVGEAVKVFRTADGRLGGVAGCFGDAAAFRQWFENGAQGDPPEFKDESEGMIAHPGGRIEWIGQAAKRFDITAPFAAIGSGFQVAMGALHAGASAEKAVTIAATLDSYSRLPIVTIEHGKRK